MQPRERREPAPGLQRQGVHVGIGADQHVPVNEALTCRGLGTIVPAVDHLVGKAIHTGISLPGGGRCASAAVLVKSLIC